MAILPCGVVNCISDFKQKSEFVYKSFHPPIHYFRNKNNNKTVFTSYNSCMDSNSDQCSNIIVNETEFKNWKCAQNNNSCSFVSKKAETQKMYENILKGEDIERAAYNYELIGTFSKEDIDTIKRNKTFSYVSFGTYKKSVYERISDKNLCFNSEQFNYLKGLINCSYAEILLNIGGQTKILIFVVMSLLKN